MHVVQLYNGFPAGHLLVVVDTEKPCDCTHPFFCSMVSHMGLKSRLFNPVTITSDRQHIEELCVYFFTYVYDGGRGGDQ